MQNSQSIFPKQVSEILATLAEIFRHQGRMEFVELVENAHGQFDAVNFDNWNGGTTTWVLRLKVPVPLFSLIEPNLTVIEREFLTKLAFLNRIYPNDPLDEVTISPIALGSLMSGHRMTPSESEVRRLWPKGRFRLFLSHVSSQIVVMDKLKIELELRGVSAFLSHSDIKPSLDWQDELERGLRSMQALAAIITPDFHASEWTDQEIGWALGRGVVVVPVRATAEEYGFPRKYQAVRGNLDEPAKLAASIVRTLLANEQTHGEMRRCLVHAFCESRSAQIAGLLGELMTEVEDFTDDEKTNLQTACTSHANAADSCSAASRFYERFGRLATITPHRLKEDDVPF